MATIADTTSAQLEKVRPVFTDLNESSDSVNRLFKKNDGNVERINRMLYRIPLLQYLGGNFAKISLSDAGIMPKGTGMKTTHLTAAYFNAVRWYRVNREQMMTSNSKESSIVDVLAKTVSTALTECSVDDDITLHTDGTGILTNPSSASAANSLTFADATDFIDVSRLREGMCVDVWDTTGATKRAPATAAPLIIISIDEETKTVTFDQNVTAIATTDIITFPQLDVYGPATLVSYTSTYPGTPPVTTAAGIGGDSFRHGFPYAHDSTSSRYYFGRQKSTVPKLLPARVNGAGTSLTFQHGHLLLNKIRQVRTQSVLQGMVPIFPMAQRAQVFDIGVAISNKQITGAAFGKSVDMQPSNQAYDDRFEYCGMSAIVSKRQDKSRVDFCNPKNWFRAEAAPMDWYTRLDGGKFFEGRDGNGAVATYEEFGIVSAFDTGSYDPGAEGLIDNLRVPPGYGNAV